ncbi:hypothetical protein C8Q79DRAFT_925306 [Trametes meyenii]|nr:hypothetical protein C8Q79DRAFT_925306 [Trametes meyenii]
MKFFSVLPAVAVAVLSAMNVVGQSVTTVVDNIHTVTTLSDNLRVVCSGITATNIFTQGPALVAGFQGIVTTVTQVNEQMSTISDPSPLGDDDAQLVVNALTTFVQVHQALLNVVIGKHSIAAQFFFTAPIAAVLRALEAIVDAFATGLIALIPTQKNAATTQFASLTITIQKAITVYSN